LKVSDWSSVQSITGATLRVGRWYWPQLKCPQ
jgi:hypothetical protein